MTGSWPEHEVDHKDRNKSNDAWENLRPATRQQNGYNIGLRKDNTTGATGVFWHKRDRLWGARAWKDGRKLSLGYFKRFEDACEARARWVKEHVGEFAPVEQVEVT